MYKMREGALLTAHRFLMLLVLVSSSSAVFVIVSYAPDIGAMLALLPGLAGALDVTFAFPERAFRHAVLAHRFLDASADLQTASTDDELREIKASLYRIYGDEPPTYEGVYALAYNQVCRRDGLDHLMLRIPWWHRLLKNVVRFSGTSYGTRSKRV